MLLEYAKKSIFAISIGISIIVFAGVPKAAHAQASIHESPTACESGLIFSRRADTLVDTIPWDIVSEFTPIPKTLKALSPICAYVSRDSSRGQFSFTHEPTRYRPRLYRWDAMQRTWLSLDTIMNRTTHTVEHTLESDRAIIGVFIDSRDMYEGLSSWYRHTRYPDGAATNIYPIGTKLRVTNTLNNKSTIVTITSTWTNTDKQRIIDLVSTAFKKIAHLSTGLIPVRIERL